MKVDWTEEMEDELINLLNNTQATYKEIAEMMSNEFATTFTKNGLIGKAARLKLPQRIAAAKKEAPITINELREGVCKWPYGKQPPYTYCGLATGDFGSWCEKHRKVVFGRGVLQA